MQARANKTILLLYIFAIIKNLLFFGAVTIPFYLNWAKLDYFRMFLVESIFVGCVFLLEIPTGVVADRFGRKISLIIGSLTNALSFFLYGFFNSYSVFILANIICAVGYTLCSGADRALLYEGIIAANRETESRKIQSRYGAMETIGLVLGLPLGSLIAGELIFPPPTGLPMTFIATGISSLMAAGLLLFTHEINHKPPEESPILMGIRGVKSLFSTTKLKSLTINLTLISATTFFIFWFYQPLCQLAGLSVEYNGFVGAGYNLFASALLLQAQRMEKLFTLPKLLFICSVLPGVMFLLCAWTSSIWVILPGIFLIAGTKLLRAPLITDLINKEIPSENRATALSGISLLERACNMVMYPFIGYLADISLAATCVVLGTLIISLAFLTKISATEDIA